MSTVIELLAQALGSWNPQWVLIATGCLMGASLLYGQAE